MNAVGILLLAAGFSRRFSGDKRRAPVAGTTLLQLTVGRYLESGLPVRVCLRDEPSDREWSQVFPAQVDVLFCDRAAEGMGASLAQGIARCDDWSATLVGLGDMPRIGADTLQQIAARASEAQVIAPVYRGRRGHPVAFGRAHYARLRALSGDRGARDILAAQRSSLQLLEVDDPGVLFDVDTPEALTRVSPR